MSSHVPPARHNARSFIRCSTLRFAYPDGTLVFDRLDFVLPAARNGLVGANGSGKSTLLALVAGELEPSGGSVSVGGSVAYLAQVLELPSGDARSGGELARERLRAAFARNAAWLLLDEPTTHLDGSARAELRDRVARHRGALLVASHDETLLEEMEAIVELSSLGVRRYGGAFSFYRAQRAAEEERARRDAAAARSAFRRELADLQEAAERHERRSAAGAKAARKANLPKVMRGALQRQAEASGGKARDVHERRVGAAKEALATARDRSRRLQVIALDLPDTAVPNRKRVLECRALNARLDDGSLLWSSPVDVAIFGPQRVALLGDNGSGKTTLLRMLCGEVEALGSARVDVPFAYLDQHAALLDDFATLIEAMRENAPGMRETERRIRLGRLGFEQERTEQRVATLSGGERMRAALACIYAREPAPQLLLLDEPDNNLDARSRERLLEALRAFRGAMLVVSHDRSFLDGLGAGGEVRLVRRPNFAAIRGARP